MKYGIHSVFSALVGLAATVTSTQAAQDFPSGPIEFVIPFGAGGGADLEGRLLAQEMEKHLGVKLIPVNKIGGGGAVTYTYIKNSPPDGMRVAWSSSSVLTTTNLGNTDFPYDAMDHVGMVEYQPQPLVVKADSKWKTLDDFAADCKANPGTIKIANGGTGSSTHAAAIAIADAMGCEVIHLPKGIKDRNKSLLNGVRLLLLDSVAHPRFAVVQTQSCHSGRSDGDGAWLRRGCRPVSEPDRSEGNPERDQGQAGRGHENGRRVGCLQGSCGKVRFHDRAAELG